MPASTKIYLQEKPESILNYRRCPLFCYSFLILSYISHQMLRPTFSTHGNIFRCKPSNKRGYTCYCLYYFWKHSIRLDQVFFFFFFNFFPFFFLTHINIDLPYNYWSWRTFIVLITYNWKRKDISQINK